MSQQRVIRSTLWILLGIALGIACGVLLGKSAAPLGSFGKFYIQLIKAIAAPLLFFAVIDAIITSEIQWKSARKFIGVVLINTTLAATIGIGLANLFQPGRHLQIPADSLYDSGILSQVKGKSINFMGFVENFFPSNIIEPFTGSNVIGVVLLAVLTGSAIRSYRGVDEPWVNTLTQFAHGGYRVSEKVIHWLVALTPIAIFGVISKSVGDTGFSMFKGLAAYVSVGMVGLAAQTFLVYGGWILLTKRVTLRQFWSEAITPVMNAFGINSSLATLPLTLQALDRLGISKSSSRLAACIGTNLNNDGILLYEAMAAIIVTQALGMDLTIGTQVTIAFICVLTSLGVAGIPEAGIISLAIILTTLGIKSEIVESFLAVDWILARMRSVTNVVADMTTSIVIDLES